MKIFNKNLLCAVITRIPAALAVFVPASLESKKSAWVQGSVTEKCGDDSVITGFTLASRNAASSSLQGFHAKVQESLLPLIP